MCVCGGPLGQVGWPLSGPSVGKRISCSADPLFPFPPLSLVHIAEDLDSKIAPCVTQGTSVCVNLSVNMREMSNMII